MASRALPDAAPALSVSPDARAALLLAPLLLLFLQFRHSVDFIALDAPEGVWIWSALTLLVTAAFAAMARWSDLPVWGRRFGKASAAFLIFYFAIEPMVMPRVGLPASHPAIAFHESARWVALALGALGLWRPGFLWGGAMWLFLARELNPTVTGFYFSTLDIRNVAEVMVWVAAGHCLIIGLSRWPAAREGLGLDERTVRRALLFVLAAGIGAHLGNYFWSALAKLAMDGGPLSWLLANDLRGHMLGSIEKRVLPYYASAELTQLVWEAMGLLNRPMVIGSFALQAFALVAPWRRRWLMAATFGFDLFHLFIFASLGLFFFKWICLNLIIFFTLAAIRDEEWDRNVARVCIAFVVAGAAFFKTAMLAWYDSGAFVSPFFEAEMADGTRHRVPSAFFASASYSVSQAQLHVPAGSPHFTPYVFGSTRRWADYQTQERCRLPVRAQPTEARFGSLEMLGRYVGEAHRIALERADERGVFNWWPYPHHHVPWPFVAEPFYDADKRQVVRYHYVLESICQTMRNGRVERRVLVRQEWPIYQVKP
jgi:hypothetical protein